jgi:hypothetical protein
LSDERSSEPVLLDDAGQAFGPWEEAVVSYPESGNAVRSSWYARAIASYIRDDRLDDQAAMVLLRRFEAVPA